MLVFAVLSAGAEKNLKGFCSYRNIKVRLLQEKVLRSCYKPAGTDTRVRVPVRVAFGEKLGAWFSSLEKITDFKDSS